MYVLSLEAATFLLVPPAPLSTINKSASTKSSPISVAPSISKSATAILPSGNTGACENVTTPFDAIVIESASEATPIVPPSLINKSSASVTTPLLSPEIQVVVVYPSKPAIFKVLAESTAAVSTDPIITLPDPLVRLSPAEFPINVL